MSHDARADGERETAYDLLQRGQALLERRHFAQAAIVLERADRQEPAKGSILEALGRAYFNSGQAERRTPPSRRCSRSSRPRTTRTMRSVRA